MPAKVPELWEARLTSLKANNPTWGAVLLWKALQNEATAGGRTDAPSQGWVSKFLRERWPQLTEPQLREYRSFYWPESMERADLPWEASAAALELLMFLDSIGVRPRPPIRLVRWYWRVRTASPDISRAYSLHLAVTLSRREEKGEPTGDRGAEWYMAYHHVPQTQGHDDPLEDRRKRYREAKERKDEPIPSYRAGLSIDLKGEMDPEFWIELIFVSMGVTLDRRGTQEENDRPIEEINLNLPQGNQKT